MFQVSDGQGGSYGDSAYEARVGPEARVWLQNGVSGCRTVCLVAERDARQVGGATSFDYVLTSFSALFSHREGEVHSPRSHVQEAPEKHQGAQAVLLA
eukprot:1188213-Prorocentrum_minimum.AAC.1